MLLFFLLQIKLRLCSRSQAADVLVVTGNDEDACGCHNDEGDGIAASEHKQGYGEQNRKAHRCHRHKADGEKNDYKNREADQSCAPIDKPHTCQEGHNGFAALEVIPYGECVAKHTTKKCKSSGKLSCTVGVLHDKFCQKYGKNGFANVDCHNGKGCWSEAVESFEIGKAGVFASKLANILFINQTGENNGTVDSAKQICKRGKCQTIEI